MSANVDQRSKGQPSQAPSRPHSVSRLAPWLSKQVSNGSGSKDVMKEDDPYLQAPVHSMRSWSEQTSDNAYGAPPMSTAGVSDSFFQNYYASNMTYPFMNQGIGGSEGPWSNGADTMFGMGYDYSNMYGGFGFPPFNNWEYASEYWGPQSSQGQRKDQRGGYPPHQEDAYYPPEMIPAEPYGMMNGVAPVAPPEPQEPIGSVEHGLRGMSLGGGAPMPPSSSGMVDSSSRKKAGASMDHLSHQPPSMSDGGFGGVHHHQHHQTDSSHLMMQHPPPMTHPQQQSQQPQQQPSSSSSSMMDGGSAGVSVGGSVSGGHSTSQPKKTSWAAIASQPARTQQQVRPRTIPRAPVNPNKPHNMDIGTWENRGGNTMAGGKLPVQALQPPPPSVISQQAPPPVRTPAQNWANSSAPPPRASRQVGGPPASSSTASANSPTAGPSINNSSNMNNNNNSSSSNVSGGSVSSGAPGSSANSHNHPSSGYSNYSGASSSGHHSSGSGNTNGNSGGNSASVNGAHMSSSGAVGSSRDNSSQQQASGGNSAGGGSSVLGAAPAAGLDHLKFNQYNPKEFNLNPKSARFFIIKSYSEDDIHRSIKYNIWCSTEHGNKRLDQAFREREGKGPVYLIFSVNGSGHFCGIAQMMSPVDYNKSAGVWAQDKWKGQFTVKWVYVKDVPNSQLRHIRLENNENKPVTNSRDTQEVPAEKGKQVLRILHAYKHCTSIFDDFVHYEKRQLEDAQQQATSHGPSSHHHGQQQRDRGDHRGDGRGDHRDHRGDRGDGMGGRNRDNRRGGGSGGGYDMGGRGGGGHDHRDGGNRGHHDHRHHDGPRGGRQN